MGFIGLRFSKERALTVLIFAVAYLLLSTHQVLTYPSGGLGGEYDVQYTTSVPQETNFTVTRVSYPSLNSAVVLNVTPYAETTWCQLPRFDYDLVVFNMTLEARSPEQEVTYTVHAPHEVVQTTQIISDTTTLTLMTKLLPAKSSSDYWIAEVYVVISPFEDIICYSLVIWANSSIPLCPVSIDLQSTDGRSLYENSLMDNMYVGYPYLTVSRDNLSSTRYRFYPQHTNHTLYLRPGSLSGSCHWGDSTYYDGSLQMSFNESEHATLVIHLKAVVLELSLDTFFPIHHVFWSDKSYGPGIYDLYLTPDLTPISLYVPSGDDYYASFSILDPLDDGNGEWYFREIASVHGHVSVNGSYNLHIEVSFGNALNVVFLRDTLLGFLSLTLFSLIILRLGLWVNEKQEVRKKQLVLDFRLIPSLCFVILALMPWFLSNRMYVPYWSLSPNDTAVSILGVLLGPIPLVGVSTAGSLLVWQIPDQALAWSFWSIILYWTPIVWSLTWCRTPSNRKYDILMGLVLFLPAGFSYLIQPLLVDIADGLLTPSFNPIFSFAIPLAWLLLIGVLSKRGYYTVGRQLNEPEQDYQPTEESKQLERDYQFSEALKKMESESPDKTSAETSPLSIGFFLLLALSALPPCIIGVRFAFANPIPESTFLIFPFQALGYLFDLGIRSYAYVKLFALLVGVPYAVFSALTSVWLWERLDHRRSMAWVLFGLIISLVSMIPGLMILGLMGLQSPDLVSYAWAPVPPMTVILLGLSYIVWERDKRR